MKSVSFFSSIDALYLHGVKEEIVVTCTSRVVLSETINNVKSVSHVKIMFVSLYKCEFVDLTFLCTIDTGISTQATSDIITVLFWRAVTFLFAQASIIIRLTGKRTVMTHETLTCCN